MALYSLEARLRWHDGEVRATQTLLNEDGGERCRDHALLPSKDEESRAWWQSGPAVVSGDLELGDEVQLGLGSAGSSRQSQRYC